ncbi:MAG TPA: hypothetical protein VIW29_21245 [Polyangiaceae bacterium]
MGRSADPELDGPLSRRLLPQDDTSGATLRGAPVDVEAPLSEPSLDDVWRSLAEDDARAAENDGDRQSAGYDAVSPEDLGATWLGRATQTGDEVRPHGAQGAAPSLEDSLVSEATLADSQSFEDEPEDAAVSDDDDESPDSQEIRNSELDIRPPDRR